MEKLKNSKMIFCGFLAVLLICSMVIVPNKAIGAAIHTITVKNAAKGQTYSAYEIFYKVDNDYAILTTSPFYGALLGFNNTLSEQDKFTFRDGAATNEKIVTVSSTFLDIHAKGLATAFQDVFNDTDKAVALESYKKVTAVAESNTCELGPLDNGYYAIKSTFGPVLSLVTIWDDDVEVYEKNSQSEFGQLNFNIVREAIGHGEETEVITKFRFTSDYDFSTNGDFALGNTYWYSPTSGSDVGILSFNPNDIKVYHAKNAAEIYTPVDTDLMTIDQDYSLTTTLPAWPNWRATFSSTQATSKSYQFEDGDLLYITLKANSFDDLNVVDNDGVSAAYEPITKGGPVDHVALAKMQTKGVESKGESTSQFYDRDIADDSFRVLGTSLIKTITGDDDGTVLYGAKFKLFRQNDITSEAVKFAIVGYDGDKKIMDVENDGSGTDVIEAGAVDLLGLGDGTYYLYEIEAPAGYNRLTQTTELTAGTLVNLGTKLD